MEHHKFKDFKVPLLPDNYRYRRARQETDQESKDPRDPYQLPQHTTEYMSCQDSDSCRTWTVRRCQGCAMLICQDCSIEHVCFQTPADSDDGDD